MRLRLFGTRHPVSWLPLLGCLIVAGPISPADGKTGSPAAALDSVVSVLPVWPGYERPRPRRRGPGEEPEGSGVAIRPGGYVITALHIVDRATSVSVRRSDGRILPANVAGRDRMTDLAILKVGEDLPVATPGPDPKLGDKICAIGNQFGLGLALTCGVVSATRRSGVGFSPIEDFIQTDASVNPGASGGALVDARGRLVGVISAIFTKQSDANIGVNFAASMELVNRVADDMIAHGRVLRGAPGLRLARLARTEQAKTTGARVRAVAPGLSASRAGLRVGDIVTRIGNRPIASPAAANAAFHMHRLGETFGVEVHRDGATVTLEMVMRRGGKRLPGRP